tara:strand:+ start:224 stop:664 length:441 start_codon:yes stop_codon:yes gene_type:complete
MYYHFYRYPLLPLELSIKIYKNIKNNAVDIITKYWYKHINKKIRAVYMMIQLNNNYTNNYSLNIQHYYNNVNNVLNYCNNVITGIEDKTFWCYHLERLSFKLSIIEINNLSYIPLHHSDSHVYQNAIIMTNIKNNINNIIKKLYKK